MSIKFEKVVVVTRKTVLEELVERFNTISQARFYLEHAGQEFDPIEAAHNHYRSILKELCASIPRGMKQQQIEREYLPQFMFEEHDLVVTLGIDGLVVNTAKYLVNQPIVAVNPDPKTIDGILLPFDLSAFVGKIAAVVSGGFAVNEVTMAKAQLSDGQELLGFNDLFVGANSHVSAKYRIEQDGNGEEHSSSGMIISTGAGSTGWLQSVYAGAAGIISAIGGEVIPPPNGGRFEWDANQLVYSVREPFPSKTSEATMVHGIITPDRPLVLTSRMPERGLIFSDGTEKDYVDFNAGVAATIGISDRRAKLVAAS